MADKWTTADISDQSGRVVIVTGSNTGIGFEAAKELARKCAEVILAVRNQEKGEQARQAIKRALPAASVHVRLVDLMDLESVRSFAEQFSQDYDRLDILINNAGIMIPPYGKSKQGFESQFATNHLAHFALTAQLYPLLARTENSRIVNVSSSAHNMGKIDFDDLHWDKRRYLSWRAYGDSKIANLYFTFELTRRLKANGSSMIVTAAHPGWSSTELQKTPFMKLLTKWVGQTAYMGSLPTLMGATWDGCQGGEYFGPSGPFEAWGHPEQVKSNSLSQNEEIAKRLWEVSEELTGVKFTL